MSQAFKPYAYQAYSIRRMIDDPVIGLWQEMGLGKTVCTLTAINDLKYNRFAISKALVIAPKKVAESTWAQEAAKWDHTKHLRVVSILGSATARKRAVWAPGDVYLVNRENVPWLVDYVGDRWPWDMVVIDEATSFKSPSAKRFTALKRVRPMISRMVELTGTPSPQGLMDLWAQIYLLDQGDRLGKFVTHYRERYFDHNPWAHSYEPKDGAEDAIRGKISDICVTMRAQDYLDLPPMITEDIPVVLDDKAHEAYKRMERDMILQVPAGDIVATTAAALSNKLQQLCNGAVYDEDGQVQEIHNCKLEALDELLETLQGQRVLIFYSFRHDASRIQEHLAKHHSQARVRVLDKPQDVDDWNAGKIDVLLAHPASAGYGLNLQGGGNHVIWFGLNWSLELYQQANKRLHRQGQKKPVFIHHLLVKGGRDEDIAAALQDKAATQDSLIDSLKARINRVREEGA